MSATPRQIIDGVLADIEFTSPVELADVVEVKVRIERELAKYEDPPRTRVEVYHRHRDVIVTAREPGRADAFYQRVLEVR